MKKIIWLPVLALGLCACFSSTTRKTYFQIHLEGGAPGPAFDKVLLIDRVVSDELYDDFRIIYRLSTYELNYYTISFWAAKPPLMIRDAMDQYFSEHKTFRRILLDPARGEADWLLRCTLHRIEEIDTPAAWTARLAMELEVVDIKSDAVLARRRFDRSEPVARQAVAAVPPVLSRILAEELAALLADLNGK
jgi:ABC-type uncharacterized transport system auxiliary subunit